MFERRMIAGWGDMDFNAHMRNSAFLTMAADVRMLYFAERGFPMSEFARLKVGPVIQKDEIEYFREVHLLDELRVTLALAGLACDGSRWIMCNEFFRPDGQTAAIVRATGGWLDLAARKLTAPPAALMSALQAIAHTPDFEPLPTSVKQR